MAGSAGKGSFRKGVAVLAFIASLLVVVWFVAAALGTKFGLWGWQFGLGKMTIAWGPMLIIGAGILSIVALILGAIKAPRIQPVLLSIFSLIILFLVFGRLGHLGSVARTLPPIHDVQTDWSDPVHFSETIMKARGDTSNPVLDDPIIPEAASARWPGMGGRRVAEVQMESYQPLQTVIKPVSPEIMFTAAFLVLNDMGIEVVVNDEENHRLEGTYTSQWYGFKDDIAVRIRPKGEGSEIDVRSTSRVGLSDLGANIERVHSFLERLNAKLAELEKS